MKTPATMVGLGVGDSLGQPFEARRDRVHPGLATWDGTYQYGERLKLDAGHGTDDTEMAVALARAILHSNGYDPKEAARRYLLWSQGTPHGMGGSTRKAMDRLRDGMLPDESGVNFGDPKTVGNGTAMRVAPLGVWYRHNTAKIRDVTRIDAHITHRDDEAYAGSLAIAWAVKRSLDGSVGDDLFYDVIGTLAAYVDTRVTDLLKTAWILLGGGASYEEAIKRIGRHGNVGETVATSLFCAAKAPTFIEGVCQAVIGGGDTDTRGAITGAILGASFGLEDIPDPYLDGLHDIEMLKQLDIDLLKGPST